MTNFFILAIAREQIGHYLHLQTHTGDSAMQDFHATDFEHDTHDLSVCGGRADFVVNHSNHRSERGLETDVSLELILLQLGSLHLNRDQVEAMIGQDALEALEEREADCWARLFEDAA